MSLVELASGRPWLDLVSVSLNRMDELVGGAFPKSVC
jgi:hypothetical protein